MRRYGLTFAEIADAVAKTNLDISGGKLETSDEEILIRAYGRDYYAEEMLDIPVRGNAGGTAVYLRDIATTRERWEDVPDKRFYNGQTSLVLTVDQSEGEDILMIRAKVAEILDRFNERHTTIQADILDDRTIPFSETR